MKYSNSGSDGRSISSPKRRRDIPPLERSRVLLLASISDAQSTLRRLLSADFDVTILRSRDELLCALLEDPEITAIVTDLWDSEGQPVADTIKRTRSEFPSIPVVACCRLVPGAAAEILVMARAGINALALRGFEDVGVALTSLVANARADCDANRIISAMKPFLRSNEEAVVEYCVSHARRRISVGDVASALSLSRRTLSYRLASGCLHSAHSLIVWCRLLIAARLLQDNARTVESIALSLRFGSAAAFRSMLRRQAGITPADLRDQGGQPFLLSAYTRLLDSRRSAVYSGVRRSRPRVHQSTEFSGRTRVRSAAS